MTLVGSLKLTKECGVFIAFSDLNCSTTLIEILKAILNSFLTNCSEKFGQYITSSL